MSAALVTGGCGFVGRHLVLRLLQQGREVWIVDDLSTGKHPDLWLRKEHLRGAPPVTFILADVRAFFREALPGVASSIPQLQHEVPDFGDVFHLAAVVGGRAKIEGDPVAVAQDLAIDADFFAWACKARPERILYASSSAAYPVDLQQDGNALPLREEFLQLEGQMGQPDMTYGWSKVTGEYLARIAARYYGLSVACVRPFSGYGEDQDDSYPIPAIAARAARREDPLHIWGSGEQGRDFVYIEDCVDVMLAALERISDGSAVNIGSGKLTTFKEVAQIFAELAGYGPQIVPLVDKPVGVHARYADTTKAKALLDWHPKVSLREGFRRVYGQALERIKNG
jgi:nucleoside-diphosphate-sugar epimerase